MPKTTTSATQPLPETSELILEAAGPIFAENGFHGTTVRQITQKAGVNVAAVNYHFHDKQELYFHVLKHAHQAAARTAEADFAGTPREQLRAFIRRFLGYLLDPDRPEWQGRLIAREMAHPTQALDRLVEESIQPVRRRVTRIVRDFLGPAAPDTQVHRACFSIIGQCLYYVHCREMIARLFPPKGRVHQDVEALADHIFQFSLAGLSALQKPSHSKSKSQRRKSS